MSESKEIEYLNDWGKKEETKCNICSGALFAKTLQMNRMCKTVADTQVYLCSDHLKKLIDLIGTQMNRM